LIFPWEEEGELGHIYNCPKGRLVPLRFGGFMLLQLGLLVIIPVIIEDENLVKLKNERHFVTAIYTVEYDYKVFLSEMRLL